MNEGLRTAGLMRTRLQFLSAVVSAVFIWLSLPLPSRCQVLHDLTTQGKTVLQSLGITPEIVSAIQQKTENGDAKAQYTLRWMYFVGHSADKSDEHTLPLLTTAAT